MASYEPEYCSKCNSCPDDILTMNCGHDLCLLCAADLFFRERRKQSNAIVCELCQQSTTMDQSSIQELARHAIKEPVDQAASNGYPPTKPSPASGKNSKLPNRYGQAPLSQGSRQNTARLDNVLPSIAPQKPSNPASKGDVVYCSEHPDDEILYFCFTCMCKCICPECVIHGPHKNHETKTIKRALPEIKDKIFAAVDFVERAIQQVDEASAMQSKQLEILSNKVSGTKKAIKQSFDGLRKCLSEQESKCLLKCEDYLNQNTQILERNLQALKQQKDMLVEQMHQINDLLKAPEIKLINRYIGDVSHYAELRRLQIVEPMEPNGEIGSQSITNAIREMQVRSQELEEIDLKLSMSSIKGSNRKEQPNQSKIVSVRQRNKHDTLPVNLIASNRRRDFS